MASARAMRVTRENYEQVGDWCGAIPPDRKILDSLGDLRSEVALCLFPGMTNSTGGMTFVKFGDWIVKTDTGRVRAMTDAEFQTARRTKA